MTEPIQKKVWGISLEFVLHVVGVIVAVTVAYVSLDARNTANEKDIVELKTQMRASQAEMKDIQSHQVRMDERFTNIMTLLTQINDRLQRQEERQ